jgi:hypothetical protein
MISGIASLFIDPKDPKIKWAKPLMLTLVVLSALATIYFGYQNQIESKEKELKYEKNILTLREENKALTQRVIDTPQKTVELLVSYGYKRSTATSATSEQVLQSGEANLRLKSDIQTITNQDIGRRESVTVQYFPKDVDPVIVQSTLQKLGFNLKVSKANISDIPTNAIWFGSKVNIEDVKLVAYTLIRAGVQIKTIKPFRGNPAEAWASLIQVGADGDYVDKPALSVSEIRNASEFVRKE